MALTELLLKTADNALAELTPEMCKLSQMLVMTDKVKGLVLTVSVRTLSNGSGSDKV